MAGPLQWEGSEAQAVWGPGTQGADQSLILDHGFSLVSFQRLHLELRPLQLAGLLTSIGFLNTLLHGEVSGEPRWSVR